MFLLLRFLVLVFVSVFSLFTVFANATSPISQIGSPSIEKGKLSLEARFGLTTDADNARNDQRVFTRQHIHYGFTDWYAGRIILRQNKFKGQAIESRLTGFENHFQLTHQKKHGFNSGIRLSYFESYNNLGSNTAQARYLLQVPFADKWQYRFHGIFDYALENNANDNVNFQMRHHVSRTLNLLPNYLRKTSIGLETFNDFDTLGNTPNYHQQTHQVGTLFRGIVKNN
ncbi:MAG: hypothetical protein ACJARD_001253, partial [Alphaproteobacteria bacterium]